VYGEGTVDVEKLIHLDSEEPSLSDVSYQISSALVDKLWEKDSPEFRPYSQKEDESDLVYILRQSSSDGFGVLLLRSRSYRKNFKINLPNLSYCNFSLLFFLPLFEDKIFFPFIFDFFC
jgi:hypothetical protein